MKNGSTSKPPRVSRGCCDGATRGASITAEGITFTYDQDDIPHNSEVKQPGEGVDYWAESPTTYSKTPDDDESIPPGNPGFTNSPNRDQMNPSSGKVIPYQMQETLRENLTYISASRVARRFLQASSPRTKIAVRISEILGNTGSSVLNKAPSVSLKGKRMSPGTGFWSFTATGSKGEQYIVRLKALRKGGTLDVRKLDVKVSCTCPFWQWQGPEHWGKVNGYLYGKPRGTASRPDVRDPSGKHWCCKHIAAALHESRPFYLWRRKKKGSGDDFSVSPLREPQAWRVAARHGDASENAAISLLEDSGKSFEELLKMVRGARILFDPVTRQRVLAKDVEEALLKLKPPPAPPGDLKVYHATDAATAHKLQTRGFIPATKPRNRGYEYAPGKGLDPGLYVGQSPRAVSSYGREILEVSLPRQWLEVPTEQAQLGETNPLRALKKHDGAVINRPIPPEAFRRTASPGQVAERHLGAAT